MLIIGHRGASGLAPENTLESLEAGVESGADMLEFDVRLTKDKVLVLVHDFHTYRTHKKLSLISRTNYAKLIDITNGDIVRLEEVLDIYFGKIMLNIELKSKGSGKELVKLLKKHYITNTDDWQKLLISSFKAIELTSVRKHASHAQLAMLHSENPFTFVAVDKLIKLSAVGFHKYYTNTLALEIAKKAGIFAYVYTVDSPASAKKYLAMGIEGIVTDRPDVIAAANID